MQVRTRRRIGAGIVVVGGVVISGLTLWGSTRGPTEKITQHWMQAEVAADGSAQVTEVIDYDFGRNDKHGIDRTVRGLDPEAAVEVSSSDAPDDVDVSEQPDGTRIRIGNPSEEVSGQHRYTIDYRLREDEVVRDGRLDWETVGHESQVGIERAEIHLVSAYELEDVQCFQGSEGSSRPCDVELVQWGHIVVVVEDLGAEEGVSIEARLGDPAPVPPVPAQLPGPVAADSHVNPWLVAGLGTAAMLITATGAGWISRRRGRERVSSLVAADAAYAAQTGPTGELRLDPSRLAELATTEFAPPENLTPAQGGIVFAESVDSEHRVAWLIDQANRGLVELHQDGQIETSSPLRRAAKVRLLRTDDTAAATAEDAAILNRAFDGRTEITMGEYDESFAKAWDALGESLKRWQKQSGLWDRGSVEQAALAGCGGCLLTIVGAGAAFLGGMLLIRWGNPWAALAIVGGLVAGFGLGTATSAGELPVRTPEGSALWLRVESFRRFLAGSEAYHAEEAARRGVLREYTAWAIALGEIDHWSRAVRASTIPPTDAGVQYATMAPALMSSTRATSTQPSSSSSGGGGGSFGGGSVGGGGGGGSTGSW